MMYQNNGWISLNERYPSEGCEVLIALRVHGEYFITTAAYERFRGELRFIDRNYFLYGEDAGVFDTSKVDYWMHLPPHPPLPEGWNV